MKRADRPASFSVCNKEFMDAIVAGNKTAVALFVNQMMQSLTDIMKERPKFETVDYVIRIEARSSEAMKEDEAEARSFFARRKTA